MMRWPVSRNRSVERLGDQNENAGYECPKQPRCADRDPYARRDAQAPGFAGSRRSGRIVHFVDARFETYIAVERAAVFGLGEASLRFSARAALEAIAEHTSELQYTQRH